MKAQVFFEGNEISLSDLEAWEKKHSIAKAKRLKQKYHATFPEEFMESIPDLPIPEIRKELVQAKMSIGFDNMRQRLKRTLWLTDKIAEGMTMVSNHKKKSSVVDIYVQDLPAAFCLESFCASILDLMTLNSAENATICLAGSPDHLVLEGKGNRIQEIIEITGGAPLESRFQNYYGVEDDIEYPKDESYPIQMAGISRLQNGVLVGDVRHQYRMEDGGFHAKLADEFPRVFTKRMIREHQFHLACEFLAWYSCLLQK